ncbi:MAG: hypothetical protein V2A54_00105 [Bacteroidota bacterium]
MDQSNNNPFDEIEREERERQSEITNRSKGILGLIIILLILIVTNPSAEKFKKYLNSKGFVTKNSDLKYSGKELNDKYAVKTKISYEKESDYLIFSFFTYKDLTYKETSFTQKYIGFFGIFFEL